jgi:hypothetical protein
MKKEISWKGLVKKTADNHKKSGKSFDFKTVLSDAGAEWKKVKSGNHPDYVVGKSAPTKRKGKSAASKTMKKSKSNSKSSSSSGCDMKEIMSKCKLCKSCQGKVKKVIGGQSGGSNGLFALSPDNFAANGPAAAHSGAPVGAPAQKASSCSSV